MYCQIKTDTPIQHTFLGKYSFGDTITEEVLCELHDENYYTGCDKYVPILEGNTERYKVETQQRFGNFMWDQVDVYTVNSKMCIISFTRSDYSDDYKKNFDEVKALFTKKYGKPNQNTEDGAVVYYWDDKFNKRILLRMDRQKGFFGTEYYYTSLYYSDGNYTKDIVAGIDEI